MTGENTIWTPALLDGEDMAGTSMTGEDLTFAHMAGADLRGADLSGARLTWADLRGADLTGADLSGAFLRGADLTRARMKGTDLTGADVDGAFLWPSVGLTTDQILSADLSALRTDLVIVLGSMSEREVELIRRALVHGLTWRSLDGVVESVTGRGIAPYGTVPLHLRPAERWFMMLGRSDRPDVSPPAEVALMLVGDL